IFTPDEAKRRRFDFTDVEHISLMRNIVRVFFGNDVSAWKNRVEYYGDEIRAKFNADTVVSCLIQLPDTEYYQDKYGYCKVIIIQKKGRGCLPLYCFYNDIAAKNTEKYFAATEGLFKYRDCDKPLYQTPEETDGMVPVSFGRGAVVSMDSQVPSDAVVLFDGTDLEQWESVKGETADWSVENGILTVNPNSGNIRTKRSFGDCQLHFEWKVPTKKYSESGVFIQNRYEVKMSNTLKTIGETNISGDLWNQHASVRAFNDADGVWQVFDIAYKAPRFGIDGKPESLAYITVFLNGVLVQNNVPVKAPTDIKQYAPHSKLPLELRNLNSPVSFRNIWIRETVEL
ncbi:MAG: DUF1080 domain-containing protein, partial [Bacteroidales bacterium]|nr:DUF1080 domain-containing protein [Bacteroidales bacterium]